MFTLMERAPGHDDVNLLRGSGHDGCRTRGQAPANATELQHLPLICGGWACLVGDRPASSRYVDSDSRLRNDFCSKTFRSRHKSTPPGPNF